MSEPLHSLNLIRLSPHQRRELLVRLERNSEQATSSLPAHKNRRSSPRWPYRRHDITVTIEHPGGGISHFLILARNLSNGGMAFIHGGYLHPTTRCRLILSRPDGGQQIVTGDVRGCRHLEGPLHEVGVQFDQGVDAETFLTVDEMTDDDGDGDGPGSGSAQPGDVGVCTQQIKDRVTEMLIRFIEHAGKMAGQLEEALDAQDLEQVRTACVDLKGSASGFGYTTISESAETTLRMLEQTMSLDGCVGQIKDLAVMCRRLASVQDG